MLLKKLQNFAQLVGYVVITLLVIYGAVSIFWNADRAFGAPAEAMQEAALLQADAKTPTYFNYQGILRDPEGNLISGVRKMTFRIYNNVTNPLAQAAWVEEHAEVTVRDGHFSVLLGNITPIPPAMFRSPDRFIGITVDPHDEMVPRQRFASVPYSLASEYAHDAATVNGQPAAAFATAGHTHNYLTAPNTATPWVSVSESGNVGVGINAPQANLHVVGVENNGANAAVKIQSGAPTLLMDGDEIDSTATTLLINTNTNRNVSLAGTGRVGIGTASPAGKLDVNGDVKVKGQPLVRIVRFANIGNDANFNTGVSATDYHCVASGWAARYDILENDAQINTLWTYVNGNTWWLRVNFPSHNTNENPDVDIVCFRSEVSSFTGNRSLNDPN
ncbi:MAG: hypothetical protein DCC55_33795 [Chloroflexi bacterium]|nr:MAG: hypothetical protein DCC55_33795 [Chloroflexota bacterium]